MSDTSPETAAEDAAGTPLETEPTVEALTGGASEVEAPDPTSALSEDAPTPTTAASATPAPVTAETPYDPEIEHKFRIIHQQHFPGSATAAHTFTTMEHDAEGFMEWVSEHRAELAPLARLLQEVL
jgi:hypothetical protein